MIAVAVQDNEQKNRSVTINDVAKLSGTSIATVSRVLNDSDYPVSAQTQERVRAAAKALNYTPNLLGHMLKAKTNRCLGVIIPSFQNPFFTQLVRGVEHAARERGYLAFVFSSQRDAQTERTLITQLMHLRISGMLLSSIDRDPAAAKAFLDSGACAGIFEADYPLDPRAIDATSNMNENSYIATSALLDMGHRDIALLTTPLTKKNRQNVCAGFHQAMTERGLTQQDVYESPYERELDDALFEFEAGRALTERLLACGKRYTALVAVNDLVACGIVHTLTKSGVRVPEDISVIGIDDIPQCVFISPTLTTVSQSSFQHGRDVCLRLIERMESGDTGPGERCYRRPELVMRESVRAL